MAGGRWSATSDFRGAGIVGVERLFTRLWRLASGEAAGPGIGAQALARARARVAAGIDAMRFNTAIGAPRELVDRASPAETPTLVLLLVPFAPYLAEELWSIAGGACSVHGQPSPAAPPADPVPATTVQLVVQVDGRVRDRVAVPAGTAAPEARRLTAAAPNGARHLAAGSAGRCMYPTLCSNFVTDQPPDRV